MTAPTAVISILGAASQLGEELLMMRTLHQSKQGPVNKDLKWANNSFYSVM